MKIKEVEARVGMTRANIRYYEKEGLLNTTVRNENNYREYTEEDIEQLQKIKILRLLGIAPADIKLLNANAISMEEIMKKRVEELEREAKQIQDIHKICETIIDKKIDVHSLNEEVLTGDRAVWMQRWEELIHKDIVNEVVTRKQVNSTIAGMLAWGYLICAVVTMIMFSVGDKLINALYTSDREIVTFGVLGAVMVVALFSIYWTANVTAHMISFHISALLLAPFLTGIVKFMLGMFGTNPTMGTVSGLQYIGFWLVLAIYIVLFYILSLKWNKMFTKIRYSLLISTIYTVVFAVILAMTSEYWLVITVILFLITTFTGMKWTMAVTDRKTFNRYYAVRHAGCMINFWGLITWSVGYDNK